MSFALLKIYDSLDIEGRSSQTALDSVMHNVTWKASPSRAFSFLHAVNYVVHHGADLWSKSTIFPFGQYKMMSCHLTILMGIGQQCQLIVLTKKSASGVSFWSCHTMSSG